MRRRHQRRPTPSTRRSSGTASRPTRSTASGATPGTPGGRRPHGRLGHPADRRDAPASVSPTVTFSEAVTTSAAAFSLGCSVSGSGGLRRVSGGRRPTRSTPPPTSPTVTRAPSKVTGRGVSRRRHQRPAGHAGGRPHARRSPSLDLCAQPATPITRSRARARRRRSPGRCTTAGRRRRRLRGRQPRPARLLPPGRHRRREPGDLRRHLRVQRQRQRRVALGDVVVVTGTAGEFEGQTQISATGDRRDLRYRHGRADRGRRCRWRAPTAFEQLRGHARAMPQDAVRHRALPARPLRPGARLLRRPPASSRPTSSPRAPRPSPCRPQNDLNRMIIDDAPEQPEPRPDRLRPRRAAAQRRNTLRGGDTTTGSTGVMTYTWAGNAASGNAYRVRPVNASAAPCNFEAANPRPTVGAGRRR